MRSTLPRHTITPVPNRRTALPPAMKWQPTPDQFPGIHQMPLRNLLMANILANTQRAQASPHPDRWASIYPCDSAIMPHEALVRSSRPSGTSNPCQTGKDTPTAEWLHLGPIHLHQNTVQASQGQSRELWETGEMRTLIHPKQCTASRHMGIQGWHIPATPSRCPQI